MPARSAPGRTARCRDVGSNKIRQAAVRSTPGRMPVQCDTKGCKNGALVGGRGKCRDCQPKGGARGAGIRTARAVGMDREPDEPTGEPAP